MSHLYMIDSLYHMIYIDLDLNKILVGKMYIHQFIINLSSHQILYIDLLSWIQSLNLCIMSIQKQFLLFVSSIIYNQYWLNLIPVGIVNNFKILRQMHIQISMYRIYYRMCIYSLACMGHIAGHWNIVIVRRFDFMSTKIVMIK